MWCAILLILNNATPPTWVGLALASVWFHAWEICWALNHSDDHSPSQAWPLTLCHATFTLATPRILRWNLLIVSHMISFIGCMVNNILKYSLYHCFLLLCVLIIWYQDLYLHSWDIFNNCPLPFLLPVHICQCPAGALDIPAPSGFMMVSQLLPWVGWIWVCWSIFPKVHLFEDLGHKTGKFWFWHWFLAGWVILACCTPVLAKSLGAALIPKYDSVTFVWNVETEPVDNKPLVAAVSWSRLVRSISTVSAGKIGPYHFWWYLSYLHLPGSWYSNLWHPTMHPPHIQLLRL